MAFKFVFNDYGAPERRVSHILAKDGEAFTVGEAVKLENGRWTKATAGGPVAGFANQNLAAGTNQPLEVILAREGDYFDAPYTGTPDPGFVVGVDTADVSADGLSVNSADILGGPFAVIEINTSKQTCRVKVKNRQLS